MKKYILIILSVVMFACTSVQEGGRGVGKGLPEKDKYAIIYFETYDRSECNSVRGKIDDGEFFLLLERSSRPSEKIIIPVNYSSQFKRDKGYLKTPIKWEPSAERIIMNLIDDNAINPSVSKLISKAESIGGALLMTDQGFLLFKNVLEMYSGKPWDKYLNEEVLGLGRNEACGNALYIMPQTPPLTAGEANYIEFKDGKKLKMKIKIYYSEN